MKIAVPLFGWRVSPRFGCSGEMMIAEIADGSIAATQVVPCSRMSPQQIAGMLAESGVSTMICGGINCQHAAMLAARGIGVIDGVLGDAEIVLKAYATGRLAPGRTFARGFGHRRGHCGPPWRRILSDE